MKLSPSLTRLFSVIYLPFLCTFSYFASYWLTHALAKYGDKIVTIPFWGLGYIEDWLPLGTGLFFIFGFAPSVYAAFTNKYIILVTLLPFALLFFGYFINDDNEMIKQILFALSNAQTFGFFSGIFVFALKSSSTNQ